MFACTNLAARIVTIFSAEVAEVNPPVPMSLLSALAVVGFVLCLFLKKVPESADLVYEEKSESVKLLEDTY